MPKHGKSRFGNPLGDRKNGRGFVGEGSWRSAASRDTHNYVADLIAMPHPEHRTPFQIADDLERVRVWQIIESGVSLKVSCDACGHESTWTRGYMARTLARRKGEPLINIAYKMRCGCGSEYLRISLHSVGIGQRKPTPRSSTDV